MGKFIDNRAPQQRGEGEEEYLSMQALALHKEEVFYFFASSPIK